MTKKPKRVKVVLGNPRKETDAERQRREKMLHSLLREQEQDLLRRMGKP